MHLTFSSDDLASYLSNQLNTFFPDNRSVSPLDLTNMIDNALEQLEYCFSYIDNKYFCDGKNIQFSVLNGDQYSMFLYWASYISANTLERLDIAEKIYLLNKALHGIDVFYAVKLPRIFHFVHPVGTVLGRASYNDYLLVYQRCSVGSNHGKSPKLGKFVTLHPGASVLGNSLIGDNCSLASNSLALDMELSGNNTYFGNPKQHFLKIRNNTSLNWRSAN